MRRRKENENLEAIIKRKTRIGTAIVVAIFLVLFIFIVVTLLARGITGMMALAVFSVTGLMFCGIIFLFYKLLKRAYEMQETYNANERAVMNKLSRSRYIKVIPKDHTRFSKEFLDDLQNKRRVEFYAKLMEVKGQEVVQVDIKYVTESNYIEYDAYLPGHFLDYYEIVEN